MKSLEQQIAALEVVEVMVATNSGTYGAAEAQRAVGSGDPALADFRVFERVGGGRRIEGADPAEAPGYVRNVAGDSLKEKRAELARLRSTLARKSNRDRAA